MNPTEIIITALVTGAAAALKPAAEQIVKDAYGLLRRTLIDKYQDINIEVLERDPSSENRQRVLEEDIRRTDAAEDTELLAAARQMLDVVGINDPQAARSVGFIIRRTDAQTLRITRIHAEQGGVGGVVDSSTIDEINIGEVSVGSRLGEDDRPKV